MKILHFAPTLQHGSATQLAADLAYALQAHEGVHSLLVAPAGANPANTPQLRHLPWSPYPIPGDWGCVLRLRSLITTRRPDIVQAYGYSAIHTAAVACRLLPAAHRPKLVGAITGYPSGPGAMNAAELQACEAVTVISKRLRAHLNQQSEVLDKAWVIPYGVNETLCYPTYRCPQEWQQHWLAERPELRGRFIVCVPGPISATHGTSDILPIIATLQQQDIPVQVLLTGSAQLVEPSFMLTLRRRIRSSGVEAHISWQSEVTDLRNIMCCCHAVINLATEPEAYNRPMLEALALGRPTIGYDHGISGEYLEAFQPVGTVPVRDYDAVADVLSQWHSNPPDPVESIPYPYRLSDTAKSYYDLYTSL